MSNLQIIEALCGLVEQQSKLIQDLAFALEQEANLRDADKEMIEKVRNTYSSILGAEEAPDKF